MGAATDQVNILAVAQAAGLSLTPIQGGRQFTTRCWMCEFSYLGADTKKQGHLTIRPDKGVFRCPRCGHSGNAWTMANELFGEARGKEVLRQARWYNGPKWEDAPVADIKTRDAVYRALLNKLILSPRHREDLSDRGLSDDIVNKRQYKSLVGWESTRGICNLLLKEGYPLEGIPGFFQDKYGQWVFLTLPGFLIPVEDETRMIQGFQIRVDDNYRTYLETQNKNIPGKYISFSSAGRKKGCSCGALIHVAVPEGKSLQNNRVWLTEGPLKADIASQYTDMPFLGIPGVSLYRQAAEKAVEMGVKRTAVAYDMDFKDNPHVKKAEIELLKELFGRGISALPVNWSEGYGKGIDDAAVFISNGQIPIPKDVLERTFRPNNKIILEVQIKLKTE
ncbi:DUF3854 domain-containing protein [Syntrophomonas palmitatica]|uniref:DUF3854 domain-containing protein n=1 Tax=Syntrophomonas palmitatica TaxID=402877 RepID=UPI0006CFB6C8|nr:DUF3854 domain-containing protein [Syntrophomonas palmitatica]